MDEDENMSPIEIYITLDCDWYFDGTDCFDHRESMLCDSCANRA